MPATRLPMRKLRELLRLQAAGLSSRQIGASLGIGGTTVVDYLGRARRAGVMWPLPDDMSDAALEAKLFPAPANVPRSERPLPHWPTVHAELKRAGVTLQLLWNEHSQQHPNSYGYSRFCELYRAWEGKLTPTMRQTYIAGERMFVDYAGTTIDIFDAQTGEVHACQLFVAVLGASSYTYAEATRTQTLPDWIGSHTRAFGFFGGVPGMTVSDNLSPGSTAPTRISPTTTASSCCRPEPGSRATRPRSRPPSASSSATCSDVCATAASCRSRS